MPTHRLRERRRPLATATAASRRRPAGAAPSSQVRRPSGRLPRRSDTVAESPPLLIADRGAGGGSKGCSLLACASGWWPPPAFIGRTTQPVSQAAVGASLTLTG